MIISIFRVFFIILSLLMCYTIILLVSQREYRRIVSEWLSESAYEAIGMRPFIVLWDEVAPPFSDVWIWAILRVTVRNRQGDLEQAWIRCRKSEILAVWESGRIQRVLRKG